MSNILNNERSRTALLNAGLAFLFVAIFVSDRWPALRVAALCVGAGVVVGEFALFYFHAKKIRLSKSLKQRRVEAEAFSVNFRETDLSSSETTDLFAVSLFKDADIAPYIMCLNTSGFVTAKPRASVASTWALAVLERHAKIMMLHEIEEHRRFVGFVSNFPGSKELANWKLEHQGDEAFAVRAGAFEIEHFQGRTNIRVLDPSKVTVEGSRRGDRPETLPDDICVPVYQ